MRIYFADLTYDTVKANFTVPLNVGYLAAKLDQELGDAVDIRLFKYPTELEAALKQSPPDLLGLSNYSWNHRLNFVFLELFKRLNPAGVSIMGGPHIRRDPAGMEAFLRAHRQLDYYIPGEGELPTLRLVQALLRGEPSPAPLGCATICGGAYRHDPESFSAGPRSLDLPSPYLTGWLDDFLKDPNMIPLFESNRGCPFRCSFCTWGNRANARVKVRDMDTVCAEIEYIASHSVGQVSWSVCDANFGILPRDIEIAKVLRKTINKFGYPCYLDLCHSKNTTKRNIEIAEILGPANTPMIGIQSADSDVLGKMGRKNIQFGGIREQIQHYHQCGLKVSTDLLIGMPAETKASHFSTLETSFDMGFDYICAINIRLLPGSRLETEESRIENRIQTKYRPIFGAYGVYDGRLCLEYEEGVRATYAMTEAELNSFKVHHLLIYLVWSSGMFRAQLRLGIKYGINPMTIIGLLAQTDHPELRQIFDQLLRESMEEWFPDEKSFLDHYSVKDNFDTLKRFMRLNSKYIACLISSSSALAALRTEFLGILVRELQAVGYGADQCASEFVSEVFKFTEALWCNDLLSPTHEEQRTVSGTAAALVLDKSDLADQHRVTVRIFRSEETVQFCHFHLAPQGVPDLSIYNLARFQEMGGIGRMLYDTEILPPTPLVVESNNGTQTER
ncbi:MAG: radical SAM protein [Humidesulfovibrio sp.]|uniref:B12-binding domain-containing radical SAM protein n=1 Tax=Humidesulfovibrio sp. TaxID=2910988 RepID=UPI0027FEF375|nr:radical SAM protein [Humidesulfovibrio sp.]MDQ7834256.1 radical SAM protein [Humidesulfovibrio sp.]